MRALLGDNAFEDSLERSRLPNAPDEWYGGDAAFAGTRARADRKPTAYRRVLALYGHRLDLAVLRAATRGTVGRLADEDAVGWSR